MSSFKASMLVLLLLLIGGAALRLRGSGWGARQIPPAPEYHSDEPRLLVSAALVAAGHPLRDSYPAGYAVQVGLLGRLLRVQPSHWESFLMPARRVSVCYGVLVVVLVLAFGRELGQCESGLLVTGMAAATSGLMCAYSHYATADIGLTFWLCATMLLSLKAYRTGRWSYFLGGAVCAGMALAFKLNWIALLPPLAAALRLKRFRGLGLVLGPLLFFAVFESADLWQYDWGDFKRLWRHVKYDNLLSPPEHDFRYNPFILTVQILAGLGLPVFALAVHGLYRKVRDGGLHLLRTWDGGVVWTFAIPSAAVFASACALSVPFARHILPALPALCVAAGFGWTACPWTSTRRGASIAILVVLAAYQTVYALGIQQPYAEDTRARMAAWMRAHFSPTNEVYVCRISVKYDWTGLLTRDPAKAIEQADYLLLHEYYYRRYLRSIFNPFDPFPPERKVYHPRDGHYPFIQSLFRGDLPYQLVHRCSVRYYTPEMILYRRYWGTYPDFVGDTLLFKKTSGAAGVTP